MIKKTGWFAVLAFVAGVFAQENYTQWLNYKTLRINTKPSGANIAANVTGYPLLVRLSATDSILGALSTGADIRFTKADGVTPLKHQIERWDTATKAAAIWVLMDTVYAGDSLQAIRMYWGKNNAADSSSGSSVFTTARGFLAVYHMSEATGNVGDATGHGYTGTNTGTTTAVGSVGQGRAFNGTNQWIGGLNTANSTAWDVNLSNTITASAWFNATNWNNNARIVQRGQTAQKWALRDTTIGGVSYLVWAAQGFSATAPRIAVSSISAGWHLVHGTANGTRIKLYLDGAVVDSVSAASAFTASTTDFGIGAVSSGANYFNGSLDEVRVHNTARDSNWIRLDYETQKTTAAAVSLGATVIQSVVIPSVTTHPVNLSVITGATAKFSVVVGGTTPLIYKWVKNNTDTIAGATSDTLTLTNVLLLDNASTYKVVIRNSAGVAVSNAATLTVTAPTVPGAPTNVLVIGASGQVTVSWTAPLSTGGSVITGYTVTAGQDTSKKCTTTGALTCIVTGLTNTTTYTFTVAASNAVGKGPVSAASNPVTGIRSHAGDVGSRITGTGMTLRLPEIVGTGRVSIIDLWGRQVWDEAIRAGVRDISLAGSTLVPGLYIVRLTLNDEGRTAIAAESRVVLTR